MFYQLRIAPIGCALFIVFACTLAQQSAPDGCPKDEYACLDVINSSQCIAQQVLENMGNLTKESMVKCLEYPGTASDLPGATKYCRCPGCHTPPINKIITEMFPLPCA
ncbi:hypothetical protein CC80DRAFT_488928 [Byssothecium circinans]|uniref:Fungal calcium binding protein domain-containing protein n=1 Tax=Byssothecium circinans TaxID=147558 RepID=A0A6A5UHT6_9PLEO|nr:hypothetical protein CC80DRAFT_488928 [Byssothecium circinans]